MPWVRLDDHFPEHPKILQAGPIASWLHVCAIAYCNRHLTDGFVPAGAVNTLADIDELCEAWGGWCRENTRPHHIVNILVNIGLWEEVPGGYVIHDYLDYQPSKEEVQALSQTRREAGKRGAEKRWGDGKNSKPDSSCHGKPIANAWPKPVPKPNSEKPKLASKPVHDDNSQAKVECDAEIRETAVRSLDEARRAS